MARWDDEDRIWRTKGIQEAMFDMGEQTKLGKGHNSVAPFEQHVKSCEVRITLNTV